MSADSTTYRLRWECALGEIFADGLVGQELTFERYPARITAAEVVEGGRAIILDVVVPDVS